MEGDCLGLPLPERLAPRPTKLGTLDLTAANLLVTDIEMHARISEATKTIKKVIKIGFSGLKFSSAIGALFQALHGLHALWRQKTVLTQTRLFFFHEKDGCLGASA